MSKILIPIVILSLFLRLYDLNWDQGFHLHPDERFLTMVGSAMQFNNYFDTKTSLLNPHNVGFGFFVYGTWPVILTKTISIILSLDNYEHLILVGRVLSALFDTGTVIIIFYIAKNIFKNKLSAILSTLFYTLAILPIQLSHFFAVDTFLVFFLTLSLLLLIKIKHPVLVGLAFGLAVSAKISAILFFPIILIKLFLNKKNILYFFVSLLVSIRVFYPYLFDGLYLNQKVIQNWQTLKTFDVPGYFPPGVQWINSTPYLYQLSNTIFFGLGLPLGLIFLISIFSSFKIIKKYPITGLLYLWIFGLFLYQGAQFAKPLRYLYPLYPAICILSGYYVSRLKPRFILITLLFIAIWIIGFLSIYSRPHTRVQASFWINQNIPAGSKISCEYWDDCLPLFSSEKYQTIQIFPYDRSKLPDISNLDYLIFSSNRLYGGIPSAPQLYPNTSKFYADLFAGNSGFTKVAEFTSRPNLPIPGIKLCLTPPYFNYGFVSKINQYCNQNGISLVDDYAEESFTVYDHPKIIIFKKI